MGNAYIAGTTDGTLGASNAGYSDAFLSKFDASGTLQWTAQLGTGAGEQNNGLAADGLGNIYISGWTGGDLAGTNTGITDAYLAKYEDSGTLQWTRQLGTSVDDRGRNVAADAWGNVYLLGWTDGDLGRMNAGGSDIFLSKYDAEGNLHWTSQFGSSGDDRARGLALDGLGNAYVSGWTTGSLTEQSFGADDAFLSKVDASGAVEWTRQFGSSGNDRAMGVAHDAFGSLFVTGTTSASFPGETSAGGTDTFLAKYDSGGAHQWTRQFGDPFDDVGRDVTTDGQGNVFIAGWRHFYFSADEPPADHEAYVGKFDSDGHPVWERELASLGDDQAHSIATDTLGNVYISGWTDGNVDPSAEEPLASSRDAFIAKYHDSKLPRDIRRYEFDGTILEFDGSSDFAADLRLGDPVRGFLSYDLNTFPEDTTPSDATYFHPRDFPVVGDDVHQPAHW